MKGYTKEQLIKDILSGIIVAIIALPLSIALAIASGVGPVQGLYTAIVAGFFMAVLNLLTMLPYTIYSNANLPGKDASVEALITWLYTGVVLMIVGMIVYQILVIPLEMTYYILADKPELKSTEAMKESLEMMHGNFGRYLMLKISFIPLMFLSVFTFYIALLWIFPYMAMTEVMFYRDLTGELKVQKQEEERAARDYVNPMFDSHSQREQSQEEQTHPQQVWRMPEEPVSYENMVIYKVHPRGYTMQKTSGVRAKGTFQGLAEKIPYWKELGITSLELMPSYDFEEYLNNIKNLSLYYDEENAPSFGDEIITLSTCDYYTTDGRFAVLAKRIK